MTNLFDRYQTWLAARTDAPAEIMTGLHSGAVDLVRLDSAGLIANNWPATIPADLQIHAPGRLAYGGYDEDRAIYDAPIFTLEPGSEPRTVHLGVDIFAPAGTPVFAPLTGRVHSFQDNANPKDYGPTLILEHDVGTLVFYTLYGHLARDNWHKNQFFNAGDTMAALGDATVNGGWPPHLHFQVILDLNGASGDFPGVFRRSQAAHWKQICPDPGPLLGVI